MSTYNGDIEYAASPASATLTQNVNQASTTTTLTSSANPSVFGQSVTFTATIGVSAPGSGAGTAPTGTITFSVDGVAGTPIAVSTTAGVTTATFKIGRASCREKA